VSIWELVNELYSLAFLSWKPNDVPSPGKWVPLSGLELRYSTQTRLYKKYVADSISLCVCETGV
jgi:hypothetical protein